ncbi:hypothetical protein [Arthrobacter cavernae]|uniref:SD-repeat containing protein B domain-containing protein n=1 Tax=Arthrobacter cavernae TaxID=2817681 RepID=A0A939HLY9_9MICC|nr:hypothetical protein [Arthrobacter cavernae]MBO1269780.1 hypothetical protein [Arthrobacter cavernae]
MVTGLVAAGLVMGPPAHADTADGGGGGYAAWTFAGAGGAYTGTLSLGGGFPEATFTSDSSQATMPGGVSTYLPAGSAPGLVFGSSSGQPYLNQRPKANNPGSPATTTYTFKRATPAGGWGFVLGDIDADMAKVSATDGNGLPVPVADLGFQGAFNYCDAPSPRPCGDDPEGFDLPVWDGATGTLNGSGRVPDADTAGASGWFRPTVALKTLTIEYTWKTGFPIYQTWFGTAAEDISGTVAGCSVAGVGIALQGPGGTVLASTVTDSAGAYSFANFLAAPGYTVAMTTPSGCVASGPVQRPVDLSGGPATGVNFVLTAVTVTPTETVSPSPSPSETTQTPGPTASTGTGSPASATPSASIAASTAAVLPAGSTTQDLANTGANWIGPGLLMGFLFLGAGALAILAGRRGGKHRPSRR